MNYKEIHIYYKYQETIVMIFIHREEPTKEGIKSSCGKPCSHRSKKSKK